MNYKQLLILRLSNLTEWLNEKEMYIPGEMHRDFNYAETCEFLGDGKYILRDYWKNGHLYWKREYHNGQIHGTNLGWHENGQPHWKAEYQNGLVHGLYLGWWENGNKRWEDEYQDGQQHGRTVEWNKSGYLYREEEYQNGQLIKRHL